MAKGLGEGRQSEGTSCKGAAGASLGVTMMATPTKTWMNLTRRFGRDGNPLRRRSDLVEAWLLPAAIAVFLALCPLIALVTGAIIRADNAAAQHARQSWHKAEAVLLQPAPGPEMSDSGANTWVVWTPASWTVTGRRHVGLVPALADSRAGSIVTVWLDHSGSERTLPLTTAQLRERIAGTTFIALAILAVLLASLGWLARRAIDRRRLAGWETAWLAVGPRWSHQE
jgi:hypothetical protein